MSNDRTKVADPDVPAAEMTTPTDAELTAPYDTSELRKQDQGQVRQLLERLASEPLRLRSDNLVQRPWGGRRLLEFKGLEGATRPGRYGESFEVAANPHDGEAARYPSIVEFHDGSSMSLPELLGRAGETVLGSAFFHAFGPAIPLLPKFLDIEGLLSVQSHPPGNPEVYIVIDCDRGATIRVGFSRDVDPQQLGEMLRSATAAQAKIGELFWVPEQAFAPTFTELLGKPDAVRRLGERLTPMLRNHADRTELLEQLAELDACYREMLGLLNEIRLEPGMVIFNADPPGAEAPTDLAPSAQVHCLGNPAGRSLLLLEVRRPGVTYRAWDHVRFPIRELAIDEALAAMSCAATKPEDFIVEPRPIGGRPGVLRSVECPAFIVDHLRPRPGFSVHAAVEGLPTTLHAIRGVARMFGPRDVSWGVLRAGESLLLPAGIGKLRLDGQTPDTEIIQVTVRPPTQARLTEIPDQPQEAKRHNLARMRSLVTESLGPTEVMAIGNGGDGSELRSRLRALSTAIFRADGETSVHAHEEPVRRGQLLGLLDALREHEQSHGRLDPDRVAVGIMLPGKGTRLSPLTQRLYGIKPTFPMPIVAEGHYGPVWLDAATASLWSWTLIARTLERQGFRGVAWKWGDEPQIPAQSMTNLDHDLSDVDAIRFGAAAEPSEDLARNKEWLLAEPGSAELVVQLRRRPLERLRAAIVERGRERVVRPMIHVGSPAFSHLFLRHAEGVFGDCEGWLDVDGYLFEALTHDERAFTAELEHDAGLRDLLERCPDFHARVGELRRRIEADRGHPLRIVVIDFGSEPYWGDVGQLDKARAVWAALAGEDEVADFARVLAGLATREVDAWGNYLLGRSQAPDDGSVRGCVLIDSIIHGGRAEGAVLMHSRIGLAGLERGAVAIESHVDALRMGPDSLAFGSIGKYLRVPEGFVHTSIVADPRADQPELQSWLADMREDPGAAHNYATPRWGNPTSFAQKFEQMRQREVEPAEIETRIEAIAAAHGKPPTRSP